MQALFAKHRVESRILLAFLAVATGGFLLVKAASEVMEGDTLAVDRALLLLLTGGVFYTLGVPFYVLRRVRYHHAIWHGFVLVGSALHFVAMINFVVPYPD